MTDRRARDGLLLVLVASAGYACFPIFSKLLLDEHGFTPLDILAWRFTLAAPLIWLLLTLTRTPPPPKRLPRVGLLLMGLLFAVVAGMAFYAVDMLPASTYTVLLYTYPAMVTVLSVALLGERLPPVGWLALALTLVGVLLTVPDFFASGVSDLGGALFALANAFTYAVYIVLSGRLLRGRGALAHASAWSITGSCIISLGLIVTRGPHLPVSLDGWAVLLGLVTISTVIPIFSFYAGLHRLGPARAAIAATVEPVITLALSAVVLSERLVLAQFIGAAVIIASVVLLQRRR